MSARKPHTGRSPLHKRLPRELKNNLGRYLGMFLLLALAIAFTSGFLVAASSIEIVGNGMRDTYNTEDGHFATNFQASDEAIQAVEDLGCTVVPQFYCDTPLTFDGAVEGTVARVFPNRTDYNKAAYAEGRIPEADDEIALDRVFCQNNGLALGDEVELAGRTMQLVGIMDLSDYTTLFQNNSSFIFNALSFTTAQVTQEAYDLIDQGSVIYSYAFFLDDRDMSLADRTELEKDMVEALQDEDEIVTDMLDHESNQAMIYAMDDITGDQMMWKILLGMLVVIMAFVFLVLTNATIEEESAVIGTLLASGWSKGALVRHYLTLPLAVGFSGAILGNVLGYTLFTKPMQNLYYNSYGFPPFQLTFNPQVLVATTVIPLVLLIAITLGGLVRRMGATPLQFLRKEIQHHSKASSMPLPQRLRFATRFRLRVFIRNLSHFVTLFFGIMFGSLLLLFGLAMMPLISHFAQESAKDVPAEHLYVLKAPLEIDVTAEEREAYAAAEELLFTEDLDDIEPMHLMELYLDASRVDEDANLCNTLENSQEAIDQAEKFAMTSLQTPRKLGELSEDITVYGIQPGSRYWDDIEVGDGQVYVGVGAQEKCGIELDTPWTLTDKYSGDEYQVTFTGTTGNTTTMSIYMSLDDFNRLLDNEEDYFSGYASDLPLELNSRYLATEITPEQMLSVAQQMEDSMGALARDILYAVIPLFLILIYLLTKTVIDRSARSISYMKVFGYHNREISRLYVRSITTTVVISLIACLPIIVYIIDLLVKLMMSRYAGNLEIWVAPTTYVLEVAIGLATYALVALLHMRHIRKVPLTLALKVQE